MEQSKSGFLSEIADQPQALNTLASFYKGEGQGLLAAWARQAAKSKRVIFTGMGTSEFAPDMILADLAQNGIAATTMDAGEWLHYPRPLEGLPVLISQSGESVETRKLAERLRTPFVGLVNNASSLIGRNASLTLLMCAGEEAAISTKTYVNTLGILFLMAKAIRGKKAVETGLHALTKAAKRMGEYDQTRIKKAASVLAKAPAIHFVSRGSAMATAKQTALTFMEGTRQPTAALTGGGFRHGPFELAGKGHYVVFFVPCGFTHDMLASMAVETAGKGSRVVVITDGRMKAKANLLVLRVPRLGEDLFPMAAATTHELLLYETAKRRGVEAGRFRYGTKITMRE